MFSLLERAGRHISFFIFFGILASVMTYPLLFNMSNYVPSDLGDPLYNIWVMEWNLHGIEIGFTIFITPQKNLNVQVKKHEIRYFKITLTSTNNNIPWSINEIKCWTSN